MSLVRFLFPPKVYSVGDSFLASGLMGELVRVENIECLPLVPRPGTIYVVTHEIYQRVKGFRTTDDLALRSDSQTGKTGVTYYSLRLYDEPDTHVYPPMPAYYFF